MPTILKTKNSVTTTVVPTTLQQGELAVNITDKKLWVGNAATTPVQLLGGGADGSFTNISVSSVATFGAGSVSAPAITTSGDTNTGIFFPAADTIAFTEGGAECARFDSSGRLGIGTTSPTVNLEIGSDTSTVRALAVRYSSVPVYLSNSYDGTVGLSTLSANNYNTSNGSSSWSSFSNTSFGSSAVQLAVSTGGADIRFLTASASNTNPSERMRIDSSGNLLVGTTSGSARVTITSGGNTGGTFGFIVNNSTPAQTFAVRNDGAINTGIIAGSPYNNTSGSAANCILGADGFLARSTSSLKYKQDVQNTVHGLAEVMQLRSVTYKGKSEADGDKVFGGLIAEEVHEAGLTEFVQYAEDGSPDALAYGNMVSLAFKAIQEQQAIITDLKARIETLESK
jgi:hypothetical protein